MKLFKIHLLKKGVIDWVLTVINVEKDLKGRVL